MGRKPRYRITNGEFERMRPHLPCRAKSAEEVVIWEAKMRRFLHAVRWIGKTGTPWRDLDSSFGNWEPIYQRFRRWAKNGTWQRMFEALQDPDWEWVMIDSGTARAHVSAAGSKKNLTAAVGKPSKR